ncbi:MAG: hypothetical protein EA425_08135 [Puniceicoccaceae bacterium]|nr:MAG: hypothetical protein EA425_08135 [Puniceicoccaceae bacterium]
MLAPVAALSFYDNSILQLGLHDGKSKSTSVLAGLRISESSNASHTFTLPARLLQSLHSIHLPSSVIEFHFANPQFSTKGVFPPPIFRPLFGAISFCPEGRIPGG